MEWNSSSSSPSPETKICLFTYMKIHSLLHSFDKHTVMEPPLQLRYRIFSSPLKYSLMQYSQCLAPSHVLLSLWLPFPECRIKKTIEYPFNFVLSRFSHIQLFATLWTVACQASLSIGFSRQEYWSGLPFPPLGKLSDPGIKPASLMSPELAAWFFTTSSTWEAIPH